MCSGKGLASGSLCNYQSYENDVIREGFDLFGWRIKYTSNFDLLFHHPHFCFGFSLPKPSTSIPSGLLAFSFETSRGFPSKTPVDPCPHRQGLGEFIDSGKGYRELKTTTHRF